MGDREELAALRRLAELEDKAKSVRPAKPEEGIVKSILGGAIEPNLTMLSGMASTPIAGLTGIAGTILPGPEGQGAKWTKAIADRFTYQPKTEGGQYGLEAISYPFRKLSEGAQYLGEHAANATDSPLVGAGTQTAIEVGIPLITGSLLKKSIPSEKDAANSARQHELSKVLQKGRQAGFKVPPSQVNPSLLNRILESIGGKSPTQQQAALENQGSSYAIAQKEASLKPGESITTDNLEAARNRLSKPYEEIAALPSKSPLSQPPFKSPAETLEALKQSRYDAKLEWAHYQTNKNPEILAKAKSLSARSDALEAQLEQQAIAAGRPELADALKTARTALAKNYTVERAMRGSSFDPSQLSRLESRGNAPLSGNLETVMQMYRDFPKAMNPPQAGGSVGVHQLMPWGGAAFGSGAGAVIGGPAGASIGGVAGLAAGQAIPSAMRSLILSDVYQKALASPPSAGSSLRTWPVSGAVTLEDRERAKAYAEALQRLGVQ